MRVVKTFQFVIASLFIGFGLAYSSVSLAQQAAVNDNDVLKCYHWLAETTNNSKRLTAKYEYAKAHDGDILNLVGAGGLNAGVGLYCAKDAIASSNYGDRVIRLRFVDDVVIRDDVTRTGNHCPGQKISKEECDKKTPDVIHYDYTITAYVIKNLAAIQSWSANSEDLIADINTSVQQPQYQLLKAKMDILAVTMRDERAKLNFSEVFNGHSRFTMQSIISDKEKRAQLNNVYLLNRLMAFTDFDQVPKSVIMDVIHETIRAAVRDSSTNPDAIASLTTQFPDYATEISKDINAAKAEGTLGLNLLAPMVFDNKTILPKAAEIFWKKVFSTDTATATTIFASYTKATPSQVLKDTLLTIVSTDEKARTICLSIAGISGIADLINQSHTTGPAKDKLFKSYFLSWANTAAAKPALFKTEIQELVKAGFSADDLCIELLKKIDAKVNPDLFRYLITLPVASKLVAADVAHLSASLGELTVAAYPDLNQVDWQSILTGFNSPGYTWLNKLEYMKVIMAAVIAKQDSDIKAKVDMKSRLNLYMVTLSSIYRAVDRDARGASDVNAAYKADGDMLLQLARWMAHVRPEYAYPLLQNASVMIGAGKYVWHPMEGLLRTWSENPGTMMTEDIVAISHAYDPILIRFLAETQQGQIAANNLPANAPQIAERLLQNTFTWMESQQFMDWLNSDNATLINYERSQWNNFITGNHYTTGARFSANLCEFKKAVTALNFTMPLEKDFVFAVKAFDVTTQNVCQ